MRKKNVWEYAVLSIFILCMVLAFLTAFEYVTRATEREYLTQAKWLLTITGVTLALFASMRLSATVQHRARVARHARIVSPQQSLAQLLCLLGVSLVFFVAGLLLRVWVIENIPIQPSSDFETYWRIANHLYRGTLLTPEGEVYRRYVALYPHTIGFPLFVLVPAFQLFGASVKTALYANLFCSMLSVLVAAHIGHRLAGALGWLVVLIAMSLWPSHILYSDMVATEPAFTLLLLLATDIIGVVLSRRRHSAYCTAPGLALVLLFVLGIVLALAGSIRPMAVLLLAAYAVTQLTVGGDPQGLKTNEGVRYTLSKGWLCALIVVAMYLLSSSIITNRITSIIQEAPTGGLTASGYNLMVGVNTQSQGLWNEGDALFFDKAYEETGSATEAHKRSLEVAFTRITNAPEDVLNLLVYKFRDLWGTDDFGVDWNLLWTEQQGLLTDDLRAMLESIRPIGRAAYLCVLVFSLFSAVILWGRTRAPRPMLMVLLLFYLGTALAHMLLETQVRYHYNVIPYLILLSSVTISSWHRVIVNEPPIKVVVKEIKGGPRPSENHAHFDIKQALREGHVRISVSETYRNNHPPKS